jgi:hypothetical protein
MLEVACDAAMRLFREPIVQVMKEVVEWLLLTGVLWGWRPGYMEEYKAVRAGVKSRRIPTILLVLWLGIDPS